MSGFPVLHCLLEFAQIHVHWVGDAIQPSHPLLHWDLSIAIKEAKPEPQSVKRTECNKKINENMDATITWQVPYISHWKTELMLDIYVYILISGCFCLVAQSCPPLCDPRDCSTPGLPVLHHLPELAQTRVHWVGDAIQPSHPLLPPSPPALNLSQHQKYWQIIIYSIWNQLFRNPKLVNFMPQYMGS